MPLGSSIGALAATTALAEAAADDTTYMSSFPRLGGETDDSPSLGRAIASAVAAGNKVISFGPHTYQLNTTTTITATEMVFQGSGWTTVLQNGNNTTMLDIQGIGFQMSNMKINVTDQYRTNYSITITGGPRALFDTLNVTGVTMSFCAGINFVSGDMGTVSNSVFSHACIRIGIYDVKVDRCYIWGMTNPFCIGVYGGNTTITNTDVVPPLLSTSGGIAGIVVGSGFNTKMDNIYLDGSGAQDTGIGILFQNGTGIALVSNVSSNMMDSDCIVLDSCYGVTVEGYCGFNNNAKGHGSREVVVKRSGAQAVQNIRLIGIQCVMTAAIVEGGTLAPAIEVESTVAGEQVSITFDIKQPGAGGGYTNPEVKCAPSVTLVGRGQLSQYPKYPANIIVFDSFTRADSATLGTADSGHTWTTVAGGISIISNVAQQTVGSAVPASATLDTGVADGVLECSVKWATIYTGQALMFHWIDASNFIFVEVGGNGANLRLKKYDGGTLVGLGDVSPMGYAGGTFYKIRVSYQGSRIKVYSNDVLRIDYTMSGAEVNKFAAITTIGLRTSDDGQKFSGLTVQRVLPVASQAQNVADSKIARVVTAVSSANTPGNAMNTDYVVLASGTTTITLPTAVGNTSKYTIKNSGAGTVTIATASSQTIDGSAPSTLASHTQITVVSDTANWWTV